MLGIVMVQLGNVAAFELIALSSELICVARDTQQNSQPESTKAIWNVKGLVNNAWHRIKVEFK